MTAVPSALAISNLSYRYGDRPALNRVSFSVEPGERVAILGPNGGGKTTLFRVITTLAAPADGHVSVFDCDVVSQRATVRACIGVVFQSPALDLKLTVRENLIHHGKLYGLSGSRLAETTDRALQRVEMNDRARDRVETLSGGLRRRVELAKVMMTSPQLLILDEPTTGLDPLARTSFWQLIDELCKESGATLLYTTHLLDEAEDSNRVIILDRGEVVADGGPDELQSEIPGHIMHVKAADLSTLRDRIERAYSIAVEMDNDALRITTDGAGELAAQIERNFGDLIDSIQISRPSLYDVFRQRTGHSFTNGVNVTSMG